MPSIDAVFHPAAAVLALTLLLAGCSSADYYNRRDRVTLAGGDAVRQNLERETLNPAKKSMYSRPERPVMRAPLAAVKTSGKPRI